MLRPIVLLVLVAMLTACGAAESQDRRAHPAPDASADVVADAAVDAAVDSAIDVPAPDNNPATEAAGNDLPGIGDATDDLLPTADAIGPDTPPVAGDAADGLSPDLCQGVPSCVVACQSDADCGLAGAKAGGAYDTDNFRCVDGSCRYLGCFSDDECAVVASGYPSAITMRCSQPSCGVRTCLQSCQSAAQCTNGGTIAAFDADNYACEDGLCRYLGCHSDAECQASYATLPDADRYACRSLSGFPTCVFTCATAADCPTSDGVPAFDADNYRCEDGTCRYAGCTTENECFVTYQATQQAYTCAPSYFDL